MRILSIALALALALFLTATGGALSQFYYTPFITSIALEVTQLRASTPLSAAGRMPAFPGATA